MSDIHRKPIAERIEWLFELAHRHGKTFFKAMAEEAGIPYQNLINLYLRDCAVNHRKLHMKWQSENA